MEINCKEKVITKKIVTLELDEQEALILYRLLVVLVAIMNGVR